MRLFALRQGGFSDILREFLRYLGEFTGSSDAVLFIHDPLRHSVTAQVTWARVVNAPKVIEEGISLRLAPRGVLNETLRVGRKLLEAEAHGNGSLNLGEISIRAFRRIVLLPMVVSTKAVGCILLAWPPADLAVNAFENRETDDIGASASQGPANPTGSTDLTDHDFKTSPLRGKTSPFPGKTSPLHSKTSPLYGIPTELLLRVADMAALYIDDYSYLCELKRSEKTYRTLTEDASDLVFSLDAAGRFTFVNRRSVDILGVEPGDLLGMFYGEILTPEAWEHTCEVLDAARRNKSRRVFFEWRTRGNGAELEVHSTLMWRHGEISGQYAIARDVTEKRRMEREIADRKRQLELSEQRRLQMKEFLSVATRAQEEERKRIARELHDDTTQALLVLSRELEVAQMDINRNPEKAARRLEELRKMVDISVENLRRFTRNLRPSVLDDLGLIPAIEWLTSLRPDPEGRIEEHKESAQVRFEVRGEPYRLDSATETALFRIAQEAYNNALRHSGARTISIELFYSADCVTLTVKDDGKGFDPVPDPAQLASKGRFGLVGMYERAELIGARLDIRSGTGSGTLVRLVLPKPQVS
ncbi:MAG TPA: PAS domain S-box protein [Clostridia bacterium]|nr:PAS domain S-box protein [Clostridia bacterium]